MWYLHDKLHRTDGPAIEYACGSRAWYMEGERHRMDGPAVEHTDGTREWYAHGRRHREDGPAVERAAGSGEWYLEGELHRADGPAIDGADRTQQWWCAGELLASRSLDRVETWYEDGEPVPADIAKERSRAWGEAARAADAPAPRRRQTLRSLLYE